MKSKKKKVIIYMFLRVFKLFLITYILFCFFIFFIQKTFIFFPTKTIHAIPNNVEELYIKTSDNLKLNAWFKDNKSKKVVIFFHWNWWNMFYNLSRLKIYDDLNFSVMMFDYRGYWKSEWEIKKENDLYIDGEAAYRYLKAKWYKDEDIILWGQSMGWAIAINTAKNRNIDSLVVESTFYSMYRMAKKQFSFLPTSILLRYKFNSFEKINDIRSKVLFIHSKNDEMIDYKNWLDLYNLYKWEKYFLETTWTHNEWFLSDYELYVEKLKEFLNK